MVEVRPDDRIGMPGFKDNHADVHGLEFAKARIQEYYECKTDIMYTARQKTLEQESGPEIRKINEKVDLLRVHRDEIPEDSKENISELASMIRSGCEIYLKDLEVMKRRTRIREFEEEIRRVTEVLASNVVSRAKGGLYDTYYSGEYCDYCGALIPIRGKVCNKCVRVLGSRISNPMKL